MIKKRNLDPSLIQWIMSQTGLGPGVGELFFVATASSATSQFRTQLQRMGVEQNYKIYDSVGTAHNAMEVGRNDVMLVYPGNYTGTGAAPLTWSKDYTHMLGMGLPQKTEYGGRGVIVRTISDSGVFAMLNTADMCQFHNVAFQQLGENAACISAVQEQGHMNRFVGCHMFGNIRSDVAALTTASSLQIGGATAAGVGNVYDDCIIGGSGGSKRTAVSGVILFTGPGSGAYSKFNNCMIRSWAEDTDPCLVMFSVANSADRLILFEDCTFYNYRENHSSTMPSYAFHHVAASPATHDILLKKCARLGVTAWCSDQIFVFSSDAKGATDGGEGIAADLT